VFYLKQMKTISQITRQLINKRPIYAEALGHGIVNYSSMARLIKKEVEAIKGERVSEEAIAISLKRLHPEMAQKISADQSKQPVQGVTLRQDIVVLSYAQSPTIAKRHQELLKVVSKVDNPFFHFDQGVRDVNLIVSKDILPDLKQLMKDEEELVEFPNCACVSIIQPHSSLDHPGVCARYFRALAWNGVNLITFFHTYAELSFVVEDFDVIKTHETVVGIN
jgi:aspartokinase